MTKFADLKWNKRSNYLVRTWFMEEDYPEWCLYYHAKILKEIEKRGEKARK